MEAARTAGAGAARGRGGGGSRHHVPAATARPGAPVSAKAQPRGENPAWIFTGISMGKPGIRGAQLKGTGIWTPLQHAGAAPCALPGQVLWS